ncbi:MAG TPA: hypothetical protein VIS29_16180 [Streptomyces sp.]|jgi:hypothetical protein
MTAVQATTPEPEGVEYHWLISYITPCTGGFTVSQRSGVDRLTVTTRHEAFQQIGRCVAEQAGMDFDEFAVLFFSLEPNRLDDGRSGVRVSPYPPVPRVYEALRSDVSSVGSRLAEMVDTVRGEDSTQEEQGDGDG